MGLVTIALQLYATVADTMGIAQIVSAALKKEGRSEEELFTSCFVRAVNRNRHKLGKLTEGGQGSRIEVDDVALGRAVKAIRTTLDPTQSVSGRPALLGSLAALFRDAVILPGHQLTDSQLDAEMVRILEDAFADYFTKLPAHPSALGATEVRHIMRDAQAEDSTDQKLDSLLQMMEQLVSQQEELTKRSPYLDPSVLQQESTRPESRNPFRIVKAEDFNHDYDRIASLFREPSIYDDLRGPDNLIIAGGRGCGKSMLLRSLSALTAIQLRRLKTGRNDLGWRESGLDFFGVYIKLARGYFYEWSPDCKLSTDAATHLFQHVFNMLVLRSLLEGLLEARNHGILRIEQHVENGIVQQIAAFGGFDLPASAFVDLINYTRSEERHVANYVGNLRLGTGNATYSGSHTSIHNFTDSCCRTVVNAVPELQNCRVFLLLDEYENLAEFQQRVVNTLAKLRPLSLSLKVAARALGVKSVMDLQGEPIQRPRDYHVVELDYNPNDARYRELLFDIATKRLSAEGFTVTDVRKLLGCAPHYHPVDEMAVFGALKDLLATSGVDLDQLESSARSEKLHHWSVALVFRLCRDRKQPFTYSGFDDFADLSSGIISSFLEFCKLAFYLAQADGLDVGDGTPIPWQTQNEAVYAASRAYFDCIERNIPETGASISRLILDLADILREKLLHHGSEPESARIIIKDPGVLEIAKYRPLANIVDDAVRWSVFHAVGQANAYFPKHKTEVRSADYLLNRVLAPILRLSPRARWRCQFTTDELARLVASRSRKASRNTLREKHRGELTKEKSDDLALFGEREDTSDD